MQRVQLYVGDKDNNLKLVDLFDDETIQVTSTIQDIRDIGKVFTDYSQTFNIPASETNNKIFRHFYNYFITNGAYDSRKKKSAQIHINYMPFRRGKIFLNDVKMKGNKAYSYNITFYGETVSIKDLIGDDELTDLSYLTNYNHYYDNLQVQSGLEAGLDFVINSTLQEKAVIYPLITSKKRLFFNSDPEADIAFNSTGNLYHDSSSPYNDRGVEFTDLKPAIKAIHIIEGIEEKYNINFTRDFFDSSAFSNLYLWLSNAKGEYDDQDNLKLFTYDVETSDYQSNTTFTGGGIFTNTDISEVTFADDVVTITKSGSFRYQIALRAVYGPSDANFEIVFIEVDDDGNEIGEFVTKTGDVLSGTVFSGYYDAFASTDPNGTRKFKLRVRGDSYYSLTPTLFVIKSNPLGGTPEGEAWSDTSSDPEGSVDIDLSKDYVVPKMKVIDFLTGIFKMFNLTAYYIDNIADANFGKIYVDTLDNYYLDAVNNKIGPIIDIDKYLDTTSHTVSSILPFTDIEFKYEENSSLLMRNHEQTFNEVFGDAEFNVRRNFPDEIDRGTKYEIKIPFTHMKYERLLDGATLDDLSTDSDETFIQWGYSAGGEFDANTSVSPPTGDYDSLDVKPLLFYGILEENLPVGGRINWIYGGNPGEAITSYWRPSNSNEAGSPTVAPAHTLNFDQEFDEWNGVDYTGVDGQESNSLYNKFYKNYVEGVFNVAKRVFKVTAYLPPNILVNYRLNDQIKIQDQVFRINSITTELTTGKSELELLNIFSEDIVE